VRVAAGEVPVSQVAISSIDSRACLLSY
jgi:hypothetical protein